MKYVLEAILISVELILAVQSAVFKRYSIINGTKAEGTGRTIPRIDKGFKCCLACEKDPNCTAVNHIEGDKTCELLYGQTKKLFTLTTAVGWSAYFKRLKDVDLLSNAVASQSSYVGKPTASRVIDDNTNGYDRQCTETEKTGARWWMVDFRSKFPVSNVILWNRLNDKVWRRLRNLRVTVGNSLQALDNDNNLCGYYTGPPNSEQDNPIRVNCSWVMYGRYLKIEKHLPKDEALSLCEVQVVQ